MGIFKNQISLIFIMSLVFILSINLHAQKRTNAKNIFLRVYNLDGKKMSKGHVVFINDSILGLNKGGKQVKVNSVDIGSIKTKRSGGHNVIIGASSGILLGAILGSVNPPMDSSGGTFTWAGGSSGEEFTFGVTVGVISGTIIGGITSIFKNSETFIIDGDVKKWLLFKEMIENTRFK